MNAIPDPIPWLIVLPLPLALSEQPLNEGAP